LKRRLIEVLVEGIRADTVERWGVKDSQITVTYRFAAPAAPAILLPHTYHVSNRTRIPEALVTTGDHIRRRRLSQKLLQSQVAEMIGVDKCSICNWESNRSEPKLEYIPAILGFLGYDPRPAPDSMGAQLIHCRTARGLSQKQAAVEMGVDACTLARWERDERQPTGVYADRAAQFLAGID
jgi:transcriptional regulator with XRE-family HTH domain